MATTFPIPREERRIAVHAVPGLSETPLDGRRLSAFSTLAVPLAAAQLPLAVYLPAIYAQFPGMSLSILGAIFLAERIWGTLSDPLIGVLSDRTRARFGARRSWIAAGAVVFALSAVALFFPPAQVSAAYLAVTLFVFYLGNSMIQIPYLAWSGEISSGYHERTRVATYVQVAGSAALLLTLALPTLIDQVRPHDGPLKLAAMGGVALLGLFVTLPLTLFSFREAPRAVERRERLPLWRTIGLILREKLLLRVLAADFVARAGQNIRAALIVFFVTFYMGRPEWASGLFLLQFVFGIAAGPLWMRIGQSFGKHRTAIAGELIQSAINIALVLVTPDLFPLLLGLAIAQGLTQNSGNLMLRSMVADVADKHRLETGENRTALFFSAFSLSEKAGTAIAVGIALPLVAWFGFDPRAAGANTPEAMRGLLWVFALGPGIAHLLAAWAIRGFSLDEARHRAIRQALDARAVA